MPDDHEERLTPRLALGSGVRRLREQEGLSLRDLAAETTYNHSYLGRVETGNQLPSDALTEALDKRFGTGGLLTDLLALAREGSIQEYSRRTIDKESVADRIQVSTSSVIPGLLQTEAYARALFTAAQPLTPSSAIDEAVAARMARQRIFDRDGETPLFWAIIDESALKRIVGSKESMREQLDHLLQAASNPAITVQVYPFDRGEHPMLEGSLTLLTMGDGETSAYLESFGAGELVESPKRVTSLTQRFDLARSQALPERESLDLIRKYLKEEYV
ncbi:helix-turn-helix domain-containing protein [Streptomyces gobiensis]|uniref:helix-turn-helix domain-containing protein n=1 Tax=Streptomyces gobiensis TaxID=2875706 RepID=UPI001E53D4A0|nr:helix-turn-helix transcriptional regulator [Streptomyces gobiensis]UGY92088.1 helix-turn-helix domain-containing protein [Streptomyces gobiensis]